MFEYSPAYDDHSTRKKSWKKILDSDSTRYDTPPQDENEGSESDSGRFSSLSTPEESSEDESPPIGKGLCQRILALLYASPPDVKPEHTQDNEHITNWPTPSFDRHRFERFSACTSFSKFSVLGNSSNCPNEPENKKEDPQRKKNTKPALSITLPPRNKDSMTLTIVEEQSPRSPSSPLFFSPPSVPPVQTITGAIKEWLGMKKRL